MSYEGYEQCICENGHYFEQDATPYVGALEGETTCPTCRKEAVWFNCVDQTNGGSQGIIPFETLNAKFLLTSAVIETCPHCQHSKQISPDIYRIPTRKETDPLRVYDESI